jgi:predicted alpha/beta-fold hydrolase
MLINSKFRPPWWLRNPHAQTLWAAMVLRLPTHTTTRERLTTPDDDFVDIDWSDAHIHSNCAIASIDKTPIVVIFHGLAGSSASPYVGALMHGLDALGYRSVAMNFRGCSGEPNLKRESYHSAHTKDIRFVIDTVAQRFPNAPLAATGYSLGGNALLKYVATHQHNPLNHAVSVSPPLQLAEGAKRMAHGLSRMYQRRLVDQLKQALDNKHRHYPALGIDQIGYRNAVTFREFDEAATVPLHGFKSVDDYYSKASTLQDLPSIETPTHILFAVDDPFFTPACVPATDAMSKDVTFELTTHGGHVAFVSGNVPSFGRSWLQARVCELHRHHFAS